MPLLRRRSRRIRSHAKDCRHPAHAELLLRPHRITNGLTAGACPISAGLGLDRKRSTWAGDEVIDVAAAILGKVVHDRPAFASEFVKETPHLALHVAPAPPIVRLRG